MYFIEPIHKIDNRKKLTSNGSTTKMILHHTCQKWISRTSKEKDIRFVQN